MSTQYTSNGAQQTTKATPKYTHNDRYLSDCFKIQVSRWPIFSIGQQSKPSYKTGKLPF